MMELFELGGMAATLVAAYQGNLLQALLNGYAAPTMYAEELGLDPTATERVLEVLACLGIADCNQGKYGASAAFKDLDAIGPGGVDGLGAMWSQVPTFLLRGERYAHMDGPPEAREAIYSAVVSKLALLFAPGARQLATKIPGRPAHILDVGAGSGIWSLAMAQRHAETRVTALDFPNVLQAFRIQAEQMGLSDRIGLLPGNFHSVTIPEDRFDRIVLTNVVHLEPPEQAAALIGRVKAALIRGGDLVIVDMLGDGTPAGERARAIYGLHQALRTREGKVHPLSDLQAWVREAGLIIGEVIELGTPRGMGVLVAHKSFT
jgi:2-polyprenyl-3-methyl-5-hydroxy-6-metoxy-1,4-benzoquinol methylase